MSKAVVHDELKILAGNFRLMDTVIRVQEVAAENGAWRTPPEESSTALKMAVPNFVKGSGAQAGC